ncbi:MAG TPA: ABC transporter substrate binding protein [Anaeromyxobacteraceae bacterium]|nr:ABC transporter substrate binding protein [Anaeromyxobacteraceae bacterium]
MRKTMTMAAALCAVIATGAHAQAGKKVLFVNSYHEGYEWSDGVERGLKTALAPSGVELRIERMDAKRHPEEAFRKAAAEKVKGVIESWKPDAVVVSDDVAVKYILQAYFKDAKVPFVFVGVNWDASKYGLPYQNATGMLEVSFAKELVDNMKPYAKGSRLAYITVDSETERIELAAYKKEAGLAFEKEVFVKTYAEWKAAYEKLQAEVDMVFIGNYAGAADWKFDEAAAFAASHAKVVSGSIYDFMAPVSMVNFSKIAEEHGAWGAKTALAIMSGTAPSAIPVAKNKQSKIVLNPKLAAGAGVVFKPDLLRNAVVASK